MLKQSLAKLRHSRAESCKACILNQYEFIDWHVAVYIKWIETDFKMKATKQLRSLIVNENCHLMSDTNENNLVLITATFSNGLNKLLSVF